MQKISCGSHVVVQYPFVYHIPEIQPNIPCTFRLSQSSCLTFGLEQAKDVVLADWSLDVADNASGLVVHELDSDLSDTSSGSGTTQYTGDLNELDWNL